VSQVQSIEDLRAPQFKSGFRHVGFFPSGTAKPYHGQLYRGKNNKAGHAWQGPGRATAEEAAQDVVDQLAQQPPLTIEDIRNPKRKSGFDHVSVTYAGAPAGGARRKLDAYRASGGGRGDPAKAGQKFQGPVRRTAEEAAQDYVDYINSQRPQQAPRLKTAGHQYDIEHTERDPEVEAALGVLRDAKAQRAGKDGYVYLIIEVNKDGGLRYGKVGYSVNPRKRVAELQTGNPRPLALHCMKEGTTADEAALHAKYIQDNVLQEWFVISKELLLEFDLNSEGVPFSTPADEVAGETNKEVTAA
jgi:Meiotically Up-regulated Gene 113 (MUG113) protein